MCARGSMKGVGVWGGQLGSRWAGPPSPRFIEVSTIGALVARSTPRRAQRGRPLPMAGDPRILDTRPVPVSRDPDGLRMRRRRPFLDDGRGRRAAHDDGARGRGARRHDAGTDKQEDDRRDAGAHHDTEHACRCGSPRIPSLLPSFAHLHTVCHLSPLHPPPGQRIIPRPGRLLRTACFALWTP